MEGEIHTTPEGWREIQQKGRPPVSWDASAKRYVVALRGAKVQVTASEDPNDGIDIHFQPPVLYKVNIRKVGELSWGAGFILPFSSVTIRDLEPDVEYELKIEHMDSSGNVMPDSETVQKLRLPVDSRESGT